MWVSFQRALVRPRPGPAPATAGSTDAHRTALRLAHQPYVIVAQDGDSDDFEGCAHVATVSKATRAPAMGRPCGRSGAVSARIMIMWTDVLDLNDFYRSSLGQMTRAACCARGCARCGPTCAARPCWGWATPRTVPAAVPGGGRARAGLHAGPAGRHALAARRVPTSPRWSTRSTCRCPIARSTACCWSMPSKAPSRCGRCCARSGACMADGGTPGRGRADPRRPVVAGRSLALLPGTSLLLLPACWPLARQHVRAAPPDAGALHAADRLTADAAHGAGVERFGRAGSAASRRQRHRGRQAARRRRRRAHRPRPSSRSCGPSCASPARATRRRRGPATRRRSTRLLISTSSRIRCRVSARHRVAGLRRGRIGDRARPVRRGRLARACRSPATTLRAASSPSTPRSTRTRAARRSARKRRARCRHQDGYTDALRDADLVICAVQGEHALEAARPPRRC